MIKAGHEHGTCTQGSAIDRVEEGCTRKVRQESSWIRWPRLALLSARLDCCQLVRPGTNHSWSTSIRQLI